MEYVEVVTTPTEADLWHWAADPTIQLWSPDNNEDRDDGLNFDEDVVKFAKPVNGGNSSGWIHPHKAVIDDMIYRLGTQLDDMSSDELIGGRLEKGSTYAKNHMSAMRIKRLAPKVVQKLMDIEIRFGA